jgi:hypothetical protein
VPLAAIAVAGCGYSRTPLPDTSTPVQPHGFRTVSYPCGGLSFQAPTNWTTTSLEGQLQGAVYSGPAVVSVWCYGRNELPPADAASLAVAATQLVDAARARDRTLEVIRAGPTRIGGAPTVALDVIERIGGQTRRVRSLHIFLRGAELVLEEYAPVSAFHAIDHAVFSPLIHSVVLSRASTV